VSLNARKRTPCVGICSTTYGDLVCRGCKRFAHEIVNWNGYEVEQQTLVWQRLHELRDAVVAHYLSIEDPDLFASACAQNDIVQQSPEATMYALVAKLTVSDTDLSTAGLAVTQRLAASLDHDDTVLAIMKAMDAEIYARSVAHYERNFKIPL